MTWNDWMREIGSLVTKRHVFNFIAAIIIFAIALFLSRRVKSGVDRLTQLDIQQRTLTTKFLKYGILALGAAAALSQMGFDLKVLLGAAGVLTIAIGFASQTSASNLISGFFLIIERPFVVGDIISVGDSNVLRGEVLEIDLLSTRIRTFANLMIRIPNETLVKSHIVNHSYFPVRRVDFHVGVAYGTDLNKVETVLRALASNHPLCLEEPHPVFLFHAFGDSAVNVELQVWTMTENMQAVKNELGRQIKERFEKEGIEIPFPTRTLIMADVGGAQRA